MAKRNRYSFKKFKKENERKEKARDKMARRQGVKDDADEDEDVKSPDEPLAPDGPLES